MSIMHKTDYLVEGLGRMLEQFKGKPRFTAIITAYMNEVQAAEDALWEIYISRLLQDLLVNGSDDTDLINKLGALVGQNREGFDNATYIRLIAARIKTNRSDGKRETMIAIASILVPETVIEAREYVGAIVITAHGPVVVPSYVIAFEFLARAVIGGVRASFVWQGTPNNTTLTLGYKFNPSAITQPTADQSPGYYGTGPSSGFYIAGGALAGEFTQDGGSR